MTQPRPTAAEPVTPGAGRGRQARARVGQLKAPARALPALHQAVAVGSPASKQHGLVVYDMATIYLLAGEVEEACRLATEALAVGRDRRSPRVIHRVRDFRAQLDARRHGRCVRQLDEQLLNVVLNP